MKINNHISLGGGWWDKESDGKDSWVWSDTFSDIYIGEQVRGNVILFIFGCGEEKPVEITLGTRVFSFITKKGRYKYHFPYSGEPKVNIETHEENVEDHRSLGLQCFKIEMLSHDSFGSELVVNELAERLVVEKNPLTEASFTFDILDSKYVDIVYMLHDIKSTTLKVVENDTISNEFEIFSGDYNMISYETSSLQNVVLEFFTTEGVNLEIKNISNRKNYYDFLNLKNHINQEIPDFGDIPMLAIQWFVSWKCNYTCSYCWQEVARDLYRRGKWSQRPPQEWAKVFNSFRELESLYFTGGEPTLYRSLPDLVNMINPTVKLSMTTNFGPTLDLDEWIEKVPRGRFDILYASYHPTELKNKEEFFRKVDRYINNYGTDGFGLEMVMFEDNLEETDKLLEFCNSRNIEFALDPFIPPNAELEDKRTDVSNLLQYSGDSNVATVRYNKTQLSGSGSLDLSVIKNVRVDQGNFSSRVFLPKEFVFEYTSLNEKQSERKPIFCPAGRVRINVDERGDVFTCMSAIDRNRLFGKHSLPHYKSLGNLFDGTYKRLTEPIMCWESFRCSACDTESIERFWKPVDFNYQLPIPE